MTPIERLSFTRVTRTVESRTRTREQIVPWVGAALVAFVALLAIGPAPVGVFLDDGIYAVLARSLAEGTGYHYINLPGAPAATHYPPGYPLFLSLLWRAWPAFPDNVPLLKGANAVLLGLAVPGLAALARRRFALPPVAAAVVAGVFTLGIPLLAFATTLFSEPLFLALLGPALLLSEDAVEQGTAGRAMRAAVLCGALVLVRTVGLGAGVALVVGLAARRRWRAAIVAAVVFAAAVVPWQLWIALHDAELPGALSGNYGSYGRWLLDGWHGGGMPFLIATVRHTIGDLWSALRVMTAPSPFHVLGLVTTSAVVGCFLVGLVVAARRAPVTVGFLLFYLGLVLVWPYAPYRFAWGIWPLLAVVTTAGVRALWYARAGWIAAPRGALLAGIVLAAVGHALYNARGIAHRSWEHAQRAEAEPALASAAWVVRNVPKDAVVASEYGPLLWLYTGRRAVPSVSVRPRDYLGGPGSARLAADSDTILKLYHVRFLLVGARGMPAELSARSLMAGAAPSLVLVDTLRTGGAVLAPVP